jgi:hypothetical protein
MAPVFAKAMDFDGGEYGEGVLSGVVLHVRPGNVCAIS